MYVVCMRGLPRVSSAAGQIKTAVGLQTARDAFKHAVGGAGEAAAPIRLAGRLSDEFAEKTSSLRE